jgi:hypothetical protein
MKRWRMSEGERERLLANIKTLKYFSVTSSFATTDAESSVMGCVSITGRIGKMFDYSVVQCNTKKMKYCASHEFLSHNSLACYASLLPNTPAGTSHSFS